MKKILLLLIFSSIISLKNNAQEVKANSPLEIDGSTIKLSKSKIELDKNGFPKQIQTFYNQAKAPTDLLFENIHFHFVRKNDGKNIILRNSGIEFLNANEVSKPKKNVKWKATSANDSLKMEIAGTINKGGTLFYNVKVTALQDIGLKDVTLHIPFIKTVPTRMWGFGIAESNRPEKVEWKWDGEFKDQNGTWLGNQDAGIKYVLEKGDWENSGKGGATVGIKGGSMLANNYTGDFEMKKGEVRHYNFQLLIKPLDSIKK